MINAQTGLYCIFGHPVGHSKSPLIHNTLFKHYKYNDVYLAFDITDVKAGIDSIKSLNIKGVSVTIPHKIFIMEYLDEIDSLAQSIGAVNTIKNDNNKLIGYNTDALGFLKCFQDRNLSLDNKTVLLLGSGGVAKAIIHSLISEYSLKKIVMAGIVKTELEQFGEAVKNKVDFEYKILDDSEYEITEEDVVINCSPIGMHPNTEKSLINKNSIKPDNIFYDVVYNPKKTKMLIDAENKGATVISGLEMFINQAILQHKIWTGNNPDVSLIENLI